MVENGSCVRSAALHVQSVGRDKSTASVGMLGTFSDGSFPGSDMLALKMCAMEGAGRGTR
jgi:hypothetical protein